MLQGLLVNVLLVMMVELKLCGVLRVKHQNLADVPEHIASNGKAEA